MNSKNKKGLNKKLLIIIPLFTILGLILIGIIISGTLYYVKKKKEARIRHQMNQVSFTNPAYASPTTITTELNESQHAENINNLTESGNYTDIETTNNNLTPSYNVDSLYNDVYPDSFKNEDVDKDYLEVQ